jgi:hypothetical protein
MCYDCKVIYMNKYYYYYYYYRKKWKSCPENWKIREKLKVLFSMGTVGPIWLKMFVKVQMRFLWKNKVEKLPGKLDLRNSFFVLFVMVLEIFQEKKSGQLQLIKESRKIQTNCKNYNFCMHSRS